MVAAQNVVHIFWMAAGELKLLFLQVQQSARWCTMRGQQTHRAKEREEVGGDAGISSSKQQGMLTLSIPINKDQCEGNMIRISGLSM